MNTKEQEVAIWAIAATTAQSDKLDEIIEAGKGSTNADEIVCAEVAIILKKVKRRLELIETNWELRKQAAAAKEHPTQDDSPTNQGECVDNQPGAEKASGF